MCDGKDNDCDEHKDEGCCEVSMRALPDEVWPLIPENQRPAGYTDDSAKSTIEVSLTRPAPYGGCTMELRVYAGEKSGGHDHHDALRPTGTLTLNGEPVNNVRFNAGEMGPKSVKYTSPEISGVEKVEAKAMGIVEAEAEVKVRVPGLEPLWSSIVYRLTGAPPGSYHPSNHYGLSFTNNAVYNIAFDYLYETNAKLGINDMSLPMGGGFDIYGHWLDDITPPLCRQTGHGHCSHRKGTSVDIERCALSVIRDNPSPRSDCSSGWIRVDRNSIEKICEKYDGHLAKESTIHCEIPK